MTIIVAARTKTGVCIAADSQATRGWEKLQNEGSKLWVAGQYAIGAAGDLRTAQVIKHFTTWPKYRPEEDTDVEAFCVKSLTPAIRTAGEGAGVVRCLHGVTNMDAEFLMAWGTTIAGISSNGCVIVPTHDRHAIGSGYAEALGYLGTKGPWTVEQVCEAANRATISAHGCAGPIDHITTEGLALVRGEA